jgi:hypothetical protein
MAAEPGPKAVYGAIGMAAGGIGLVGLIKDQLLPIPATPNASRSDQVDRHVFIFCDGR